MENTAYQTQLADYISACAFKNFEHTHDSAQLQVLTIHTPKSFSRPLIEFSEALEAGLALVTEINESGSVQQLAISNLSDSYLLLYEGTMLQGGKQNRVINATQLIPPHSKHIIPASCIEPGRWNRSSAAFRKSPHHSPSFLRKSIREEIITAKCIAGSQSRVWDEVNAYASAMHLKNPSGDFADIYNRSNKNGQLFPAGLPLPPAEGVLLQVNGEYTMDLVSNEPAFGKILPQLSAGYEQAQAKGTPTLPDNPGQALAKIIQNSSQCHAQPAAAAGTDVRLETSVGNISALIFEGEVVSATMTAYSRYN
jgi:hypothetical protein